MMGMEGENTHRRGFFITGYVAAKTSCLRIASVKLTVPINSKPQKPRSGKLSNHHV